MSKDKIVNQKNRNLRRIGNKYDLLKLSNFQTTRKENDYEFAFEFVNEDIFDRTFKLLYFTPKEAEDFYAVLHKILGGFGIEIPQNLENEGGEEEEDEEGEEVEDEEEEGEHEGEGGEVEGGEEEGEGGEEEGESEKKTDKKNIEDNKNEEKKKDIKQENKEKNENSQIETKEGTISTKEENKEIREIEVIS